MSYQENSKSGSVFDKFFQYSIDLLCIADKEGNFIKLNPVWEKTLGYKANELEGKPYIEFVHPDDVQDTIKAAENLANNREVIDFTNRYRHKNGTYRWLEWRSFPEDDKIYAIVRDITEKKEREEELRKSEKKYRVLFENMPSAFALHKMIYDDKGTPVDYKYIEVNPGFEKQTGVSASVIKGKTVKELFPETEDYWIQTFDNVVKTGTSTSFIDYSKELGKYYEAYVFNLEKDLFAVIFNDVTERIENEENLKLFKLSIDNSSEAVYWVDKDANLVYTNEYASKMLGYAREEFLRMSVFDIAPTYPKEVYFKNWAQHEKTQKSEGIVIEHKHKKKDGSFIDIEVVTNYVWLDNKKYNIAHVRDITERKKADEALRRSEQKYKQLFENITSAIALHKMIYDEKGNPKDYEYIEVNPAFEKQTGISAKNWIGKTVKEVLPGTEDYWIETFGRVAKTGKSISYVNFSKELNKHFETLTFCPKRDHFAVVFNDVTDRVNNEKILNKFKVSIDNSLDGVYWINEEGGFDYVNEQVCKMLGYSNKELVQLKISDIDPNADDKIFKEIWDELVKNERFKSDSLESFHKRKDGSIFPVELNSVFVWNDNEGLLISYVKDISERKEHEVSILKNQKLLNETQRIASIGSWDMDLSTFNVIWSNETYSIFGFKDYRAPITLEIFFNFIHPEDRESIKTHVDHALKVNKLQDFECRIIRKDKKTRHIYIVGEFIFDNKNKPLRLLGAVQDITERKEYENQILKNQRLLNESQRIAQMGSWEVDLQDGELNWSDSTYNLYGVDKDQFVLSQEAFYQLVHPDDREYVIRQLENTLLAESIQNDEFRIVKPDGQARLMSISAEILRNDKNEPVKLLGIIQDITEKRQAEKELEETKTLLAASVMQAPIPMVIASASDYKIRLTNNAAGKILGVENITKYVGKSLLEIQPVWQDYDEEGNPIPFSEVPLALALQGIDTKNRELSVKRKDGTIRYESVSATAIHDNTGKIIAAYLIFPDITDKKKAEEELIRNQKLLTESQRAAQIGSYENDLISGKIFWNEEAYRIFGYEYQEFELTMEKYKEMVFPDDIPYVMSALKNVIQTKKYHDYEYRIIRKDGEIRNIRVVGDVELNKHNELIRTYGIFQDITEQKKNKELLIQAKESAEESEQKMQRIFEFAPVSIGVLNNRVIYDVNSQACNITGYTKEELIGKQTEIVFPSKKEYEKVGEVMYQQLEENGFSEFESKWKRKDGKLIYVYLALTYLDPDDPSKGVLFSGLDITKKKEAEQQLINAKKKAEESDNLKTAFLANLSHEIRTPMNGILGFADLIKNENLAPDVISKYIHIIESSGERMLRLINDLIDISKIESNQIVFHYEKTNLNELIDEIYNFFILQANEKSIKFTCEKGLDNSESDIIIDKLKMGQVLSNVLNNALKFTKEGTIHFKYKLENNKIIFSVKDTGVGILPGMEEVIFERFNQAENNFLKETEGLGLGLSISKSFIEKMGGKIWVESEYGKGAEFFITIPFEGDKNESTDKKITQEHVIDNELTILIAEDDGVSYLYIETLLTNHGFKLYHAENGKQAIELFNKHPEINLILMDLKMPVMNGIEATSEIRKKDPKIPIIAQTAYAFDKDKQMAMDAGCSDFITKPIIKDLLMEKIANALNSI